MKNLNFFLILIAVKQSFKITHVSMLLQNAFVSNAIYWKTLKFKLQTQYYSRVDFIQFSFLFYFQNFYFLSNLFRRKKIFCVKNTIPFYQTLLLNLTYFRMITTDAGSVNVKEKRRAEKNKKNTNRTHGMRSFFDSHLFFVRNIFKEGVVRSQSNLYFECVEFYFYIFVIICYVNVTNVNFFFCYCCCIEFIDKS